MEKKFTTKCTKILATVGAIEGNGNRENLEKIIKSGANGLRVNFSHAKYDEVSQQIKWIREIAINEGRNVSILADLQGPKIRLGNLKDDMKYEVKTDDELRLTYGIDHDGSNNLPIQYDLSEKVKPGERLFIFDGKISTEVTGIEDKTVIVQVKNDGYFSSRKGINLPDTDFSGEALTTKDLEDLDYVLGEDFDYVCLSFVHVPNDVEMLRSILKKNQSSLRIVSKIETRQAIERENLEEIIKVSDGAMVARGDMGFEVGVEVVPVVQQQIIELCQKHCRISIIATQMMGSMVDNPKPTRAEASDVANAAIQGADAVMLSEESAVGKYPVEAVSEMRKILIYTQNNVTVRPIYTREITGDRRDALAVSAVKLAEQLGAAAIIVETFSGEMARKVAIHRPNRRIIAVSGVQSVAQQLPLLYGTRSYYAVDIHANYGVKIAKQLHKKGAFGESPVTLVIVKSSNSQFESSVADTIFILTLE